jgi:magnesium chelatase family protein
MDAGESSEAIRKRVIAARAIQEARFANEPAIHCNAQMNSRLMKQWCALDDETMNVLRRAMLKFNMSARAYDRILKVARTIADLAGSPNIQPAHMREAVNYRNLDRSTWGNTMM